MYLYGQKSKACTCFLLIFFCLLLFSCKTEDSIVIENGVSKDLADVRKEQISEITYNLHFKIPNSIDKAIASRAEILFHIKDTKKEVTLDFKEASSKLKSIAINGDSIGINHQKEHIIIHQKHLVNGENSVEIFFDAGETSLNRNNDFLYTLLVPDRARTLFPCFDQPNLKAKYKLRITAPKDWEVLAGAFEESAIEIDDFTEHTFAESDAMSTYLFSFVAGKFNITTQNPGTFDMTMLYRENDAEKIKESTSSIYQLHQNSLDFLESYTDVKFPFQKMDFATIPPFQYGGMEHVGAIQYRESSLFLDKNATQNQLLGRAKLIAHETSHMWFGDLVTMRWFNDVWMKEVFANFMADKIVNPVYPDINHQLSFMMTHYPSAYSEDRTKGTNAIRQKLDNLNNAGSLYGRIIYNKAPIMMRQLEYLLGEDVFQQGVQKYIKTYQNNNADWNDLVSIFDETTNGSIRSWSDVWVNSSGRPIFYEEIETNEKGNVTKFVIHQKAEDGSNKIWTQSFAIQLIDERGYVKKIGIKNMGKSFDISEAVEDFKPGQILYNTNGFGYGVFPIYKDKLFSYKKIKDDVSRGYQFINLYENMLMGEVAALEVYKVFLDAIQVEKNELIVGYLSGRLQAIFWTFLAEENQYGSQLQTEKEIWNLLQTNLPSNLKKTLFNLYESVAYNPKGIENLYAIWNKETTIEDLFLSENNYLSLAMTLAIYNHPNTDDILKVQQENIKNPDRLERFQWLLPSLSADETIRNAFMESLLEAKNREKESWVQTALGNLHHPLRHESSIKHLASILNKLEEVQQTGDIFFPKGWLASSIGNYSSKEAYTILQNFIDKNPDYSPNLLQKLHQTTDNLVRAQTIKK